MNLHLAEISSMVSPGKHAVLLLDQAGWHLSGEAKVPANITLLPLPPKCPELSVMENIWQFMEVIGYPTGCSAIRVTSLIIAVMRGTGLSASHGASCLLGCGHGCMGTDQWGLV